MCPEAIFVEGNPAKYVSIALEILEVLKGYSPVVEPFSIDEAFADMSGIAVGWDDALDKAIHIKGSIRSKVGLTASVGISFNKSVAKVASDLQKPDGLTLIRPQDVTALYYPLPVERLWGVGPKTKEVLGKGGIRTIGQLARLSAGTLVEMFGANGTTLSRLARGNDEAPVIPYYQGVDEKSMGHEYTFPVDVSDYALIERTLLQLCDQVGRRLRKGDRSASRFTIRLRYADFTTVSRSRSVPYFTHDDNAIFEVARSLVIPLVQGRSIRMIGVSASRLARRDSRGVLVESRLFEVATAKLPVLHVTDTIRDRYGEDSLVRARLFADRPMLHS